MFGYYVRCGSFLLKLAAAAEHLQSYLDRADRPVAGTTYLALHDLIEKIDASHCLSAAVEPPANPETNQQSAVSELDECQLLLTVIVIAVVIVSGLYFWL